MVRRFPSLKYLLRTWHPSGKRRGAHFLQPYSCTRSMIPTSLLKIVEDRRKKITAKHCDHKKYTSVSSLQLLIDEIYYVIWWSCGRRMTMMDRRLVSLNKAYGCMLSAILWTVKANISPTLTISPPGISKGEQNNIRNHWYKRLVR